MSEISLLHVPRQLVLFRVGETRYGVDIASVGEILPILSVTATPGAPGGVLGLADVRKKVVPIFDLHWKFGIPRPEDSKSTRLILVEVEGGSVAMLVDAVEEVVTVKREDFQGVTTPGNTSALGYLNGVLRSANGLTLWVDHNRLVPQGVADALAA